MFFLKKAAQLRETNQLFNKRRKTKNKRFQKEKTLTIQEKQTLLAKKEKGGKKSQLTTAKGSRRKRVKTKKRKCGVCGKPGHNTRTCKKAVNTSSEEKSD